MTQLKDLLWPVVSIKGASSGGQNTSTGDLDIERTQIILHTKEEFSIRERSQEERIWKFFFSYPWAKQSEINSLRQNKMILKDF